MELVLIFYGGIGMNSETYFYGDLPDVLEDDEQQRLLEESINGNDDAKRKLQIHNLRIITYVINKYFDDTQYEKKDLFSIGCIGLGKAINTYNPRKKVKFITYAIRCVFNEIGTFCRNNNKYQKVDSLNRVLYSDGDRKLRLMDTISDEKDITNEIERKEVNRIIGEIVSKLPERDRKIVEMSFGFNGIIYKQGDISSLLLLSQSYVSKILKDILFKIKEKLIEEEIFEREPEKKIVVKSIVDKNNIRKRKIRSDAYKSIYEHFKDYSKEQIDEVISNLSDIEKELIIYKYGSDYESPTYTTLDKTNRCRFTRLVNKMRNLLNNKVNNIDTPKNTKTIDKNLIRILYEIFSVYSKKEFLILLEFLKKIPFEQIVKMLSSKDAVIVSLRLGMCDGKYFSDNEIASILDISQEEVIETTKKVLLLYRDNFSNYLKQLNKNKNIKRLY